MIHVELQGIQSSGGTVVSLAPFVADPADSGPFTFAIAGVPQVFVAIPSSAGMFRNHSPAGQILGLSANVPGVTIANAHVLLYPGESFEFANVSAEFWLVSDAAGGVVRRIIFTQA